MEEIELVITNLSVFKQRPLLPVEIKKKWLEALKGGKYLKGKLHLSKDNKYCCLGVLCKLQQRPEKHEQVKNSATSFDHLSQWISDKNPLFSILDTNGSFQGYHLNIKPILTSLNSLSELNDNTDTFDKVIEVIEKYF